MLGQGDVDFMDYNVSYYTIGALGQRPWLRLLYAYPATPGKTTTVEPDLATALPTVSNGGKTYTVTIRTGADWDTSPARQVTAADALLGLKRSCNPTQPFGGLPDFEALIVGYQTFCNGFAKVSSSSVSAIKNYIDSHQISGVKASGQTITYNLVHPASYFPDMLQLDAFAPAPVESLNYLVGSSADAQHIIADGPYKIQSYVPARSIVFVRNPAWKASTDPIRKAYVNEIKVSETGNEPAIQQQLQTNTAAAQHGVRRVPAGRRRPGPGSADEAGAEPQLQPRLHLLHEPVRRVQRGVAEQQRRAEQGRGPAGAQLRHRPGPPAHRQRRPDPGRGPHARAAGRDQRVAGRARRATTRIPTTRPRPSRCWPRRGTRTG